MINWTESKSIGDIILKYVSSCFFFHAYNYYLSLQTIHFQELANTSKALLRKNSNLYHCISYLDFSVELGDTIHVKF